MSRDGTAAPERPETHAVAQELAGILMTSLKALADAGETESACQLAGKACVALRHSDPQAARRFDVLLHRLTPKLAW